MTEEEIARRIFKNFNEFLFEFFKIPVLDKDKMAGYFSFEGMENLNAALARGRGVILASAHVGNWEMAGAALALLGYKLHVVAGIQFSRALSEHVKDVKRKLNIEMVSPEEGYRALFRALNNNEIVVLLVDGDVFANGLKMNFFSKPARIPSGAAALALKTQASIVTGFVKREGRLRFKMHFDAPITPHSTGNKADDVERLSRTVLSRVESYIEDNLDQWSIFRDIWAPDTGSESTSSLRRAEEHALDSSITAS